MKRLICGLLVLGAALTARAQGLPPESFGGALWGAMLGGSLGSDCHHGFSGPGAAIGAGVGFIVGTIAGEGRRQTGEPYPACTTVSVSAGHPACGSPYVYYAPNAFCAPGYYYRPASPVLAVSTTVTTTGAAGTSTRAENVEPAPQATTSSATQAETAPEPATPAPVMIAKPAATMARQIPDAPRVPDAPTF